MTGRRLRVAAIVAGVLIVIVTAGLLVLDSMLTSKAHEQARQLSQQWGRPVQIGSVATKFITGVGAKVNDLQIGPAPGETLPLVTVGRAEVKVGLLRALFSGGKDVRIRSAEIEGLNVNLIRLRDGTTNLEKFQNRLADTSSSTKEPPPPPEKQKQGDLSFLRVDHFALIGAQVAFVDLEGGGSRTLGIKDLDVRADDLRAGKPLDLVLKAAVLADKQNLELRVKSAPLPPTLTPTPTMVVLKVDPPIDLAHLGPYAGKEVGLQGGTFDADFKAELGGAVAGGSGPTRVQGKIELAKLRFAGAEGGKALDVVLDTDVKGDAQKGDVQIDRLKLDLGPAGITGKGAAHGLNTPTPRIEGLEIVSHDLDPARLAAYYPPLQKQLAGRIAGPIGLSVRGSGTQAAQALELRLDFTPVRLSIPQQMSKAAGGAMTFVAHVRGAVAANGPIRFDAKLDLHGVDLRPGESLDKAPGQRFDLTVDGTRRANDSSTNPEQRIEIKDLKAHVLDDELGALGFAEVKGAGAKKTTKFDLQVASSRLDLDKLLLPSKTEKKKEPLDPKTFAGLSGHAAVKIDLVRYKKQDMRDVIADVTVVEDHVKVNKADVKAFGGTVTAAGTEMKLAHPDDPFHVIASMQNLELANALALLADHDVLAGKFNGKIDLKGGGQKVTELARTLAGVLEGHVLDGAFLGKDIVAAVTGPLSRALPLGLAGKTTQGGKTDLGKDLPLGLTIENGVARLKQPISVTRPEAQLSFGGGIRLDGTLDMPGTVALSPQTIAAITGGRAKPSQPVPISLRLTGPAWSPIVADLDLKPAVSLIVKEAGTALVGRALGVDTASVDQKRKDFEAQAQQKQQQVTQEAQKRAQQEADAQRKKAEEEAQKQLKGLFGR